MPSEADEIGIRLRRLGWRSGSVLTPEHAIEVAPFLVRHGEGHWRIRDVDRVVVVSQTCDIVVPKLAAEPYVELLLAEQKLKIDSRKANLRSTRYLSFRVQSGGEILEAHAANRFFVSRELLEKYKPDGGRSLDVKTATKVSMWLGLRYTRPAWPESLVARLKPRVSQLESILSSVRADLAEIRIAISDRDRELLPEEPYRLTVYGIIDSEIYDTAPEAVMSCTAAFNDFLAILRGTEGISVDDESEILPGHDFDWQLGNV